MQYIAKFLLATKSHHGYNQNVFIKFDCDDNDIATVNLRGSHISAETARQLLCVFPVSKKVLVAIV